MNDTLVDVLIDKVFNGNYSDTEWLALEKEAMELLEKSSVETQDVFAESGAGEALHMICSGIRQCRMMIDDTEDGLYCIGLNAADILAFSEHSKTRNHEEFGEINEKRD